MNALVAVLAVLTIQIAHTRKIAASDNPMIPHTKPAVAIPFFLQSYDL